MATKKTFSTETGTLFAATASGKKKTKTVSPSSDTGTLFSAGGKKKKPKPAKVRSMLLSTETGTLFAAVSGTLCLEDGGVTKTKLKLTKTKEGKAVIKVVD